MDVPGLKDTVVLPWRRMYHHSFISKCEGEVWVRGGKDGDDGDDGKIIFLNSADIDLCTKGENILN